MYNIDRFQTVDVDHRRICCSYNNDLHNFLTVFVTVKSRTLTELLPASSICAIFNGVSEPMKYENSQWMATFDLHRIRCIRCGSNFTFVVDFTTGNTASVSAMTAEPKIHFDFSHLLETKTLSPVTFKLGSITISAHLRILASGSRVFAAMLHSDYREEIDRVVVIDDVKPEIFEKLLNFIYTGEAKIDQANASDLLVAANMFGVQQLKKECGVFLSKQITIDNVIEYLILSYLQNVDCLYRLALDFISNDREVFSRYEWLELVQKYPKLGLAAKQQISFKYATLSLVNFK